MDGQLSPSQRRKIDIALARKAAARAHAKNQKKGLWVKIRTFFGKKD